MNFDLVENDISDEQLQSMKQAGMVAMDSETLGLQVKTDRLCLLQLSSGDGRALLVKFSARDNIVNYQAPNIKKLLQDKDIVKIFHFARFDMAVLYFYLQTMPSNIYCTKIASKIIRPDAKKHSLGNLSQDLLGITLDKEQQVSNWGLEKLSDAQLTYAASDVLYLHQIKEKLEAMANDEQKKWVATCHQFLSTRVLLDIHGMQDVDVFAHH